MVGPRSKVGCLTPDQIHHQTRKKGGQGVGGTEVGVEMLLVMEVGVVRLGVEVGTITGVKMVGVEVGVGESHLTLGAVVFVAVMVVEMSLLVDHDNDHDSHFYCYYYHGCGCGCDVWIRFVTCF